MSEQILKALMQLFAIISRPQSNRDDRRIVVENFIRRLLNDELVQEYLRVFDEYYADHQSKLLESKRSQKRTSASSVKVLLICTEINEELTQKQKVFVLVQLLEFVKTDTLKNKISDQELEFLTTVSDVFKISREEFGLIHDLVMNTQENLPFSDKIVLIDSSKHFIHPRFRHIYCESFEGQVKILQVTSTNIYLIKYNGNSELYLNGQMLTPDKVYVFNTGSSIRNPQIKPVYFGDVVSLFQDNLQNSKILFEAKGIEYTFKGGTSGLKKMSFSEESGKLIGIMGASGAGKSTLMNVLNGSLEPTSGQILINGIDIYKEKNKIEGIIGYVSQDDLLIEELTVFENLYFNAQLCFGDLPDQSIHEMAMDVLQNLGLQEIKNMKVGSPLNKKISGGQRKRLNIALELIREPGILFLDEPTSGLSSRDSENIMDLLKELSFKGKLIFVVIHQPSSDIFKMFDKLIMLDAGGYLIYNGDPIESIIYFKSKIHHANWNESECHVCGNVNPEQIFNIIESKVLDENGKLTHTRKISAKEWNSFFISHDKKQQKKHQPVNDPPKVHFKIPGLLKQYLVFTKRDVLAKLANTQYLIINILEAPLLAFILSYLIKYFNISSQDTYTLSSNSNLPVYIFMSIIVAIFVGLSVSAEEIIKDRKILKREAFLNLSWMSYLLSKVAILFVISAIQAFLFVLVGNSIIQIKGMFFIYWLVLFSAWAASNIVGMIISDSFKTIVTIYILIPFLVIPQIILSGVIVKYDKLNPSLSTPHRVPFYGEFFTARWAYEALAVHQFMENDYEKYFYPDEKVMSLAEFKRNYWIQNLMNKTNFLLAQVSHPEDKQKVNYSIKVLSNELKKENNCNQLLKFRNVDMLTPKKINADVLSSVNEHLEKLKKYYIKLYNKANGKKDSILREMEKTPERKSEFLSLKMANYNEKLYEFVTNRTEVDRIVEYDGNLYQKENPIYLDGESAFVKAHFYAPRKMIFGHYFNTLWVNVAVIWMIILAAFAILYFRLLKKILDSIEFFTEKLRKIKS